MSSFGKQFGFKEAERDSFEPDPETDISLYVDLDRHVEAALSRLAIRSPKLVFMGDYGTGKTHLLHVLASRLDLSRVTPVYVKLDAFGRTAESRHLHDPIISRLEALGLLQAAMASPPEDLEHDIALAFKKLRQNPTDPDARSWLLARGPTPTQARRAGFSARLSDFARGVAYARIWRVLGRSYKAETGREILILLDETETFQEIVDPTRAADMGVAIREIVDRGNTDFGVVMGLTAPKARGGAGARHPLMRGDVASRVQDKIIELQGLGTEDRRRQFIHELLARLLQDPDAVWTRAALEAVVQLGDKLPAKFKVRVQRDPVQRDVVKALDHIARRAIEKRATLPIQANFVRRWLEE